MKMKKYKCIVCGHVHEGNSAPDKCPLCAAPVTQFEQVGGKKSSCNKNSNTYIITYATVMVVVVAAVLSFAALSLKGIQAQNVIVEKKGDILRSIGEGQEANEVADKAKYIDEMYAKYIVESYAVNVKGDKVEGADAFSLLINLKAEYDKPADQRKLPIFVSKDAEGTISYVIPVWGTGLWGPVWGYVALAENWDTVKGVVFDHKSETPGLGAEISTVQYQSQFIGKQIIKDGQVIGIRLQKGGAADDDPYAVDAVSGGTLTSVGVQNMLKNCLGDYNAYIEKQRQASVPVAVDTVATSAIDSLTLNTVAHE